MQVAAFGKMGSSPPSERTQHVCWTGCPAPSRPAHCRHSYTRLVDKVPSPNRTFVHGVATSGVRIKLLIADAARTCQIEAPCNRTSDWINTTLFWKPCLAKTFLEALLSDRVCDLDVGHIFRSRRGFQNGRKSSILGQRSITTLRPAFSASFAASSS